MTVEPEFLYAFYRWRQLAITINLSACSAAAAAAASPAYWGSSAKVQSMGFTSGAERQNESIFSINICQVFAVDESRLILNNTRLLVALLDRVPTVYIITHQRNLNIRRRREQFYSRAPASEITAQVFACGITPAWIHVLYD
jgi:hypothetical protein